MRNIKSIILFSISMSLVCLLSSCVNHSNGNDSNNTRAGNYYRVNPRYISDYKITGLERFRRAQTQGVLQSVERELRLGHKKSHWIWYIFPQMKGLGSSDNSNYYGIDSLEEARQYLTDSVLSARLIQHTWLVLNFGTKKTLYQIFGLDEQKFVSSMTLFNRAAKASGVQNSIFAQVLQAFNNSQEDARTLRILGLN
jgi:uncharacterized protein (DUF1810 family)